jgi:hypothetical protein
VAEGKASARRLLIEAKGARFGLAGLSRAASRPLASFNASFIRPELKEHSPRLLIQDVAVDRSHLDAIRKAMPYEVHFAAGQHDTTGIVDLLSG